MPKGYWIAHVEVTDPEAYAKYRARTASPSRNTARAFWCAAERMSSRPGAAKSRQVVIEFPDYAAALACLESEEYKRAVVFRDAGTVLDLVIVEGYDGPQPGGDV